MAGPQPSKGTPMNITQTINGRTYRLNTAPFREANPGITMDELRAILAEHAADGEATLANTEAFHAAKGTGPKSLARYEAHLSETGRLTRREVSAVRRALALGRDVPDALLAAVQA